MKRKMLGSVIAFAIAISCISASLLNNRALVTSSSSTLYRYTVKFKEELEWEEIPSSAFFAIQGKRLELVSQYYTHINIYNPNPFTVKLNKTFVCTLPENESEFIPPEVDGINTFGGRAIEENYLVPAKKGFEIDAEDVLSWPPDPDNPWYHQPYIWIIKGFVIIECEHKLDVVAVYTKKTVDLINKISFHIWPEMTVDTPKGKFEFNKLYAHATPVPPETDDEIDAVMKRELELPEGVAEIEIVGITHYFDFLGCTPNIGITYILRPTYMTWEKWLNETWPDRPPDWTWPDWFKPCTTLEQVVQLAVWDPWRIRVPEEIVRGNVWFSLIISGVPDDVANEIMREILIEIIDVDVAEGLTTSLDVEYIQPEIIETPTIT